MADEYHLRIPVQRDKGRPAGTVTWDEHLEAWRAYNERYPGTGWHQSADVIAQRGGFGYREITSLLGHEPTTWKEANRG